MFPGRSGEIFGDYICDHAFAARCRSDSRCRKFPSVPPRMERPAPDRDPGSGSPGTRVARHACAERSRRGLASWLWAPDRGPGRQCWCSSDIDERAALAVSTGFLSPSEGNPALHSQAYEFQIFRPRCKVRGAVPERFLRSLRSVEMTGGLAALGSNDGERTGPVRRSPSNRDATEIRATETAAPVPGRPFPAGRTSG